MVQDTVIRGQQADLIDGGALRDSNLFHSFSEFNVGESQRVYFANPTGVENIFSRITGTNGSNLMGTLGVEGGANLFVLNPNGILFGPNAQLDVSGSFVVSTAEGFIFSDGSEFSATNPQGPELLSVNVNLGVQWGPGQAGPLTNNADLAVSEGQTLTLFGGKVTHAGSLTAPGGTVEVLGNNLSLVDNASIDVSGSTGGTVLIGGDYQGQGTTPRAISTTVGPEVTINADAMTSGDGGTVIVWADGATRFYGAVTARGGSDSGNGGFVEVSSPERLVFEGRVNTTAPHGATGNLLIDPTNITIVAGGLNGLNNLPVEGDVFIDPAIINNSASNIVLQASNNITFDSPINVAGETIGITAEARNAIEINRDIITNRGSITFRADTVTVNGSEVLASTNNENPSGNIEINAREISIVSGRVFSNTTSSGSGGTVTIGNSGGSADIVTVSDGSVLGSRSGFGTVGGSVTGSAGSMTIDTRELIIVRGGVVTTSTFRQGMGGNLTVRNAERISVSGFSDPDPSGKRIQSFLGSVTNSRELDAESAMAGITTIITRQLIIDGGARVAASTSGVGDGGNLNIQNAELIQVSGVDPVSGERSFLGAKTELVSESSGIESGDAGLATISTRQLLVEAGGEVSVGTSGTGDGGSLEILNADTVTVRGAPQGIRSFLGSQSGGSAEGTAGSTTINARQLIVEDGGLVSAQALDRGAAGSLTVNGEQIQFTEGGELTVSSMRNQAGNLNINASSLSLNNSTLRAVSDSGENSGNININLSGPLLRLENGSRITAEAGTRANGGNVTIVFSNEGFILARPSGDSDILASARAGQGGNINVTAAAIFGIDERNPTTDFSDFNASSEFSVDGEIILTTLGIDPSRGLLELPVETVDVGSLVATGCVGDNRAGVEEQGEYTVTGRGGIAQSPTQALSPGEGVANLATLDDEENLSNPAASVTEIEEVETFVEAQGLTYNASGKVVIGDSTAPSNSSAWLSSACREL
ncbi:filamentous hemagglutinin N-terminal domain-containing protein [Nodosilinea sp. LEGE 07088]|nr:filamentous hemagglutinin N-terminal domain-containing protein [Nodosilinea sp. LEGE 07088]